MKNDKQKQGFTLVELLVSVGITAVLLVGMSVFFSTTFRNMFQAREAVTNTQEQFVVNTIVSSKFASIRGLREGGTDFDAVIENDIETGDLPFTYINRSGSDNIEMTDFLVFNGISENGAFESKNSVELDNAAGVTEYNGDTYVVVPTDNKVYQCDSNMSNCSDYLTDLDHPVDIINDGINFFYVSNAGSDEVLQVNRDSGVIINRLEADLNFPTGLTYYGPGNQYLFIADTYNHQVKKYTLATNAVDVVVGAGEDESCDDITASFCKLNFPTGLIVGGGHLYISDTGNARILRVKEPDTDLTDVEVMVNIDSNTQISTIDFTFPLGSDLANGAHGATADDLHKGLYTGLLDTLTYGLTASYNSNEVVCLGPDPCTNNLRGFFIDEENNIFEVGDDIDIDGTSYSVSAVPANDWVRVAPKTPVPAEPNSATVTESFSSGDYNFYLDLSTATLTTGFVPITIQPYDETPAALTAGSAVLRIGDGELGTAEDLIEVVPTAPLPDFYPTGLGWSGNLDLSATADYDTTAFNPDYTGSFTVRNFDFDTTGDILNLTFEALISGTLGQSDAVWEIYTLNADTTP